MSIIKLLPICIFLPVLAYFFHPKFGCDPKGKRLERIKLSRNYKNDRFVNIQPFVVTQKRPVLKTLCKLIKRRTKCDVVIPSTKTDLGALDLSENVLVWFGHSSYFIQISQKRIIVDPVLSKVSSPIPCFPQAFQGSTVYKPNDIPHVDYVIITHDHWDHLDYRTITKLNFGKIICPLGVGAHLERFGIPEQNIIEMDWDECINIDDFKFYCLTTRHWSRRGSHQNKTLWASFLVEAPNSFKTFIGGDGGYGPHFSEIGRKFGEIDLAILENGQYNKNWTQNHMHPQEVARAAEELNAKTLLPVHYAKFSLSTHKWNEPVQRICDISRNRKYRLITPMIGEKVELMNKDQTFSNWW
ncbi:MAG: MBL fold metallo-hydrolase [Holosporales bacterium]|jgi:L-ascorbate metabolism protein UlaG (beta-lactamase superfamily)|nr:MBL fold metallo-hydrolase [Holosporales bacterium]